RGDECILKTADQVFVWAIYVGKKMLSDMFGIILLVVWSYQDARLVTVSNSIRPDVVSSRQPL
ncbi:hypothetical protein BgiBS90_012259, partial [Biomphalaria glabrata]